MARKLEKFTCNHSSVDFLVSLDAKGLHCVWFIIFWYHGYTCFHGGEKDKEKKAVL